MLTLEIKSNETNALQIEETQVLQANTLQKNCQESKRLTWYINPFYKKLIWKGRATSFLVFWTL